MNSSPASCVLASWTISSLWTTPTPSSWPACFGKLGLGVEAFRPAPTLGAVLATGKAGKGQRCNNGVCRRQQKISLHRLCRRTGDEGGIPLRQDRTAGFHRLPLRDVMTAGKDSRRIPIKKSTRSFKDGCSFSRTKGIHQRIAQRQYNPGHHIFAAVRIIKRAEVVVVHGGVARFSDHRRLPSVPRR